MNKLNLLMTYHLLMSLQQGNDVASESSTARVSQSSTRCLGYDEFLKTYERVESSRRGNFTHTKHPKRPKLEHVRDVMVSTLQIHVTFTLKYVHSTDQSLTLA